MSVTVFLLLMNNGSESTWSCSKADTIRSCPRPRIAKQASLILSTTSKGKPAASSRCHPRLWLGYDGRSRVALLTEGLVWREIDFVVSHMMLLILLHSLLHQHRFQLLSRNLDDLCPRCLLLGSSPQVPQPIRQRSLLEYLQHLHL